MKRIIASLAAIGVGFTGVAACDASNKGDAKPQQTASTVALEPNGPHISPLPGTTLDPNADKAVVNIAGDIERRFGIKMVSGTQTWPTQEIYAADKAAYGGPIDGRKSDASMMIIITYGNKVPADFWSMLLKGGKLIADVDGHQGLDGIEGQAPNGYSYVAAQRSAGGKNYVLIIGMTGLPEIEKGNLHDVLSIGEKHLLEI